MDGVHNRLHIYPPHPCVWYFTSPGIGTRSKGPTAFSVSSERHWQSGVKEIAKVSKRSQWDSIARPLDCQSHALSTEPPPPAGTPPSLWLWIRNRTRWSLDYWYGRRSRGSFRIPNTKWLWIRNRTPSARNYSYGKWSRGKFRILNAIASRIRSQVAMNHAQLQSTSCPIRTIWTLQGLLAYYVVCSSPIFMVKHSALFDWNFPKILI